MVLSTAIYLSCYQSCMCFLIYKIWISGLIVLLGLQLFVFMQLIGHENQPCGLIFFSSYCFKQLISLQLLSLSQASVPQFDAVSYECSRFVVSQICL